MVNVFLHSDGSVELTAEPFSGPKLTRLTPAGRRLFHLSHVLARGVETHQLWMEAGMAIITRDRASSYE